MPPTRSLRATAYHEAGHAVAAHVQGIKIRKATIKAEGDTLGGVEVVQLSQATVAALERGRVTPAQRARIEADVIIDVAGAVAEHRHRGRYSRVGSTMDRDNVANKLLRLSNDAKEAYLYAAWLQQRTLNLIEYYWWAVEAVAQALLANETLTSERIAQVIDDARPSSAERRA